MPKREKIDSLRKKVRMDIFVRGTARKFKADKKGRIPSLPLGPEVPAYFISPLHNLDSKEWISRLHSTVHATVARALGHGKLKFTELGKIKSEDLPVLMTFGPDIKYFQEFEGKSKNFVINYFRTVLKNLSFDNEYPSERLYYEHGLVHGRKKRTFKESKLSFEHYIDETTGDKGGVKIMHPHLFEVGLTVKEFNEIVSSLNKKLKSAGFSSLKNMEKEFWNAHDRVDKKRQLELWKQALSLTTHGFEKTREVTPLSPARYLLYTEVARILTTKFVKEGLKWANQLDST